MCGKRGDPQVNYPTYRTVELEPLTDRVQKRVSQFLHQTEGDILLDLLVV